MQPLTLQPIIPIGICFEQRHPLAPACMGKRAQAARRAGADYGYVIVSRIGAVQRNDALFNVSAVVETYCLLLPCPCLHETTRPLLSVVGVCRTRCGGGDDQGCEEHEERHRKSTRRPGERVRRGRLTPSTHVSGCGSYAGAGCLEYGDRDDGCSRRHP